MTIDDISLEWTETDSEGLVRVIATERFSEGVGIVAKIAELAEQQKYDPEIKLETHKVTVCLFDDVESYVAERDYLFAKSLDDMLGA